MRIAIVGSGISGLVCAHRLHRRHEITLFEAAPTLGGHTHTIPVALGGRTWPVDTGFIVFNRRTYPGFCRLLEELEVPSRESEMSFGVRCEGSGLEYATRSGATLFAQPENVLRPSFHRMLRDVLRFHRDARRFLERPDEKPTLEEWLMGRRYSSGFLDHFLFPMGAAIWSTAPSRLGSMPALTVLRFFDNHGLLARSGQPGWRVVEGGSWSYVERLVRPFHQRIRLRSPVRAVRRVPGGVEVSSDAAPRERFDRAILAVHSDQALALLADPSPAESAILGAIRYQENEALLHTDASVLPRRRRAWASWNVRVPREPGGPVRVTYHMNRLQGLDAPVEFCVTLNASDAVDPRSVLARMRYAHPLLDGAAVAAQQHFQEIDGVRRTHFCGAYWGTGFHEDGLRSALRVVERIEGERAS